MAVTEGDFQIFYSDAGMSRKDSVFGPVPTTLLDISTDPRQKLIVPYQAGQPLKEDDVMIFALKGITAGTFDSGTSVQIPVTMRSVTTGIVSERFLSLADLRTMADAVIDGTDISYSTAWTEVMKYTIPAQYEMRLGHKLAENSRIYVALVLTA